MLFKPSLDAAGFDQTKVLKEWSSLRIIVKSFYRNLDIVKLWEKLFVYKREFPNILMLAELATCFSSSNCAVERMFSILTIMLTDQRLSITHTTMEDSLIISANDRNWSNEEREDILTIATKKYLQTQRTAVFAPETGSSGIMQQVDSDSDSTDHEHQSDEEVVELDSRRDEEEESGDEGCESDDSPADAEL